MRSSNKSRSRNKNNNRNRNMGNIVNRVFDSAGPEGKVRGTPQQIIEKYTQLTRDAQLAGDRVAAENFQQHAEHYTRMLDEAQKEQAQRQAEQQQRQQARQDQNPSGGNENQEQPQQDRGNQSPVGIETVATDDASNLVDLPENSTSTGAPSEPKPRRRKPRASRPADVDVAAEAEAESQPDAGPAAAE